jgi:hypothetical protein
VKILLLAGVAPFVYVCRDSLVLSIAGALLGLLCGAALEKRR